MLMAYEYKVSGSYSCTSGEWSDWQIFGLRVNELLKGMLRCSCTQRYVRRHQDQLPVDLEIKKKLDAFHNLR